ncbi:MAG: DNA-formamidopyrimidine glycosylase [Deltaproteobacteria bacterium]
MPELPEVESVLRTLRDGLPALPGRVVMWADIVWDGVLANCCDNVFQASIHNSKFTAISRHGKYLIFALTGSEPPKKTFFLIVHLRMTGRLYLVPQEHAFARFTRISLQLDEGLALRFDDPRKFGRVWLVQNPDEVTFGLGPDALTVDFAYFASRIVEHRRQIKPLLLDQSFVAGIGNIYADECLFRARINPITSSDSLKYEDIGRLYIAITGVLSEAVYNQGANIDGVFKEGSFAVSVYGRTGRPCLVCNTAIAKIRVGQRGTHYCPLCQPLRFNHT